jgi:hypothetical protein
MATTDTVIEKRLHISGLNEWDTQWNERFQHYGTISQVYFPPKQQALSLSSSGKTEYIFFFNSF